MFRPDRRDLKSETRPWLGLGCETPPQAGRVHPVGKAGLTPLLHLIFQERPWARGARGGGHTIVSIRTFQPSEAAHLSGILAEAFLDNPLNCAVINRKPRSRLQVNRAGMDLTLDSAREGARVLTARTDENQLAGGLIAVPPGRWPLPPPSFSRQLLGLWRQGIRISSRWGHIYQELALQHPEEPHWYLSTLGIHPKYQRRGLASALLDHWLLEVAEDQVDVYLETDHPESLSFYLKRGFRICEERELFGVPIWRMLRPADFLSS